MKLPLTSSSRASSQSVNSGFGQWSESIVSPIRQRLGSRLLLALSLAAALSTLLVGASAWKTWTIYRSFSSAIAQSFTLNELSKDIVYYDEVLTMSARMAASTGNPEWEARYETFVPQLDQSLEGLLNLAPQQQEQTAQTDAANAELIALETQAFNLVRQGQTAQALNLLLSPQYNQQKAIYSTGINSTLDNITDLADEQVEGYNQQLFQSMLFTGFSLPILILSWAFVLLLVRSYIQERVQSQADLEGLNENLQQQLQQIDSQEQATRRESEVLQEDVGEILDAVSAVESGDLTREIPVNERVTGLVADTLNRLTEELARVLGQVLSTAGQVSRGAQQLEKASQLITANTDQQAQSVTQVLNLTEQVEQSAQASAQQIQSSVQSLSSLRKVVEEGQSAIASLNKGIDILQQGTRQMVQQMKALGEFVGLTDQFVQEQRQIASLTQVLAMNASLVAARASEQRDPNQFVVVAREFESIANQVGTLAQRTNDGLVTLEQRSTQIHKVVSTVDANVQNLDGLVEDFTQGVEQSNQVFQNVRTVTGEAVAAGEGVAQSSQKIVSAAQSTTQVMREIADLANRTAQLTQQANQQTQQIEGFSEQLLENIRFFRLPESLIKALAEQVKQSEAGTTLDVNSREISKV